MNFKNAFLAAVVAVASVLTPIAAATAADIIAPIPHDRPVIIQVVDNFEGPYWGVGGSTILGTNEYTPTLSVGVNKRFDAVVVGGEIWGAVNVIGKDAPSVGSLGFDAKAGFVVTENVAVYAIAGVEADTQNTILRNAIGVGADVALTENVYLTGSYKRVTDFMSLDNPSDRVSIGLKFPF